MKGLSILVAAAAGAVLAGPGFHIIAKPGNVSGFPVPYVQPTSPNSPIALDIAPTGRPKPLGNHGTAWVDVLEHGDAGPLATGRLGINATAVWLGSMSFGGAKARPVEVVVGSKPVLRVRDDGVDLIAAGKVVGSIEIKGSAVRLSGFKQLDDIEKRLRTLEASN